MSHELFVNDIDTDTNIDKEFLDEFENIKKEIEKNNCNENDVLRNQSSVDADIGFTVDKIVCKKGNILVFTFMQRVTDEQFQKFIAVLNKAVDEKKPFALLVDTRQSKGVPVKASIRLASWMKKRKPDIPGVLLGSSITTKSDTIINLVKFAFSIQKPTSPNLMNKDIEKSKKFLEDIMNT